jgi:hypothetical protein
VRFPAQISTRSLHLCAGVFILLTTAACSTQQAQSPPSKPAPPPLEFLGEWGTRGDGPGQLSWPSGIAVDATGNVYVVEGFNRFVHKFTVKGEPLFSFQDDGIRNPGGIAVDSGGAIYVAADSGKQIIVFLPDGARFRVISGKSIPFEGIRSICLDTGGNVFVSEFEGHRLRELDPMGRQIAFWGRKATRDLEFGRLGPAALGSDGAFYVYDYDNSKILTLSPDLKFLSSWPVPEKLLPVEGIAVSKKYLLTIAGPSRLAIWTREGQLMLADDLGGRIKGGDALPPVHLALVPPDQLLVLDVLGARVLRFRINF